jgi:hypothetical protein
MLRPPTQDRYELDVSKKLQSTPLMDAATIERLRQSRFKPGIHVQVMPIQLVPPPPDHESILRIKATS